MKYPQCFVAGLRAASSRVADASNCHRNGERALFSRDRCVHRASVLCTGLAHFALIAALMLGGCAFRSYVKPSTIEASDVPLVTPERTITVQLFGGMARDRSAVDPNGLFIQNYQRNPILFSAHDRTYPIGRCNWLKRDARGRWIAEFEIFEKPEGWNALWMGDYYLHLWRRGVGGVSIGIIELAKRDATAEDRQTYGALCETVVTLSELVEVSAVMLPGFPCAVQIDDAEGPPL